MSLFFKGYGGYLKDDTDITYVIINKYQLMRLKKVISSIDENAFVVIHDVHDVFGGSFAWDEVLKKVRLNEFYSVLYESVIGKLVIRL